MESTAQNSDTLDIKVSIDAIVAKYRDSATDKDKYDELSKELYGALDRVHYTHYEIGVITYKMSVHAGCERGMYKDFLMLKKVEMGADDVTKIHKHTKNRKLKLSYSKYMEKSTEFDSQVKCYAPMDQFYSRSRSWREGELLSKLFIEKNPFSMKDINTLVEQDSENYRLHNSFYEYINGDYVPYGWIITVDEDTTNEENSMYRLVPVGGWDGINIPEGKVSYKDYDDK